MKTSEYFQYVEMAADATKSVGKTLQEHVLRTRLLLDRVDEVRQASVPTAGPEQWDGVWVPRLLWDRLLEQAQRVGLEV